MIQLCCFLACYEVLQEDVQMPNIKGPKGNLISTSLLISCIDFGWYSTLLLQSKQRRTVMEVNQRLQLMWVDQNVLMSNINHTITSIDGTQRPSAWSQTPRNHYETIVMFSRRRQILQLMEIKVSSAPVPLPGCQFFIHQIFCLEHLKRPLKCSPLGFTLRHTETGREFEEEAAGKTDPAPKSGQAPKNEKEEGLPGKVRGQIIAFILTSAPLHWLVESLCLTKPSMSPDEL